MAADPRPLADRSTDPGPARRSPARPRTARALVLDGDDERTVDAEDTPVRRAAPRRRRVVRSPERDRAAATAGAARDRSSAAEPTDPDPDDLDLDLALDVDPGDADQADRDDDPVDHDDHDDAPGPARRTPRTVTTTGARASAVLARVDCEERTDRLVGWRARLPWILVILGLVGTIGFATAWARATDGAAAAAGSTAGEATPVLTAAETFSLALTNFDGATVDRDFDRVIALSTGEFRTQADTFFSAEVRTKLKAAQASSRGEVASAYIQNVDGDRASVFVVVDQTIANNKSPQPAADTLRMEVSLQQRDGRWLVSRVDVLGAPAGATTTGSPGAGTTPTTAGN